MEDAATSEISRAQLWQWIHHGAKMSDGRKIDAALCDAIVKEELEKAKKSVDPARYAAYEKAAQLMRQMYHSEKFVEFLTVPAYEQVLKQEGIA
jgi:malate synthase